MNCEHKFRHHSRAQSFICEGCGVNVRDLRPDEDEYFILRVNSRKWKRVLQETGGWTPMMAKWTKPKNKKKPVRSVHPIFSSWVILPFDHNHYHEHKGVYGVRGVFKGPNKKPVILRPHDYQALKDMEERELSFDPDEGWTRPNQLKDIKIGSQVRVDGVLGGIDGVVMGVRGGQVSVNIGGNHPIWVDCCLIEVKPV